MLSNVTQRFVTRRIRLLQHQEAIETMMEPSAKELVAAMHRAVQETPSLKSRFNASVEFRFDDVKERIDITKKSSSKETDPPDLIVTTSLPVFHQLLNKKLTPQQAFMQGKLKIKGKVRPHCPGMVVASTASGGCNVSAILFLTARSFIFRLLDFRNR